MKRFIKKITVAVCLTGLMLSATACGKSDPVKDDLYTYLTDMSDAQALQKEAIDEYNAKVSGEDADSQQLLTALNDTIIPKYQEYLDALDAVAPETEEVQAVKAVCVDGASKQMEALQKVAEAITDCDTDMLNDADDLIAESETIFADYESQVQALADEHEITLTGSAAADDSTTEAE